MSGFDHLLMSKLDQNSCLRIKRRQYNKDYKLWMLKIFFFILFSFITQADISVLNFAAYKTKKRNDIFLPLKMMTMMLFYNE